MKAELRAAIPHLRAFAIGKTGNAETGDNLLERAIVQAYETRDRGVVIADPGHYVLGLLEKMIASPALRAAE